MAGDFGRNCGRNTQEENKCREAEFQTLPIKHRRSNHFVHFYPKGGGTGSSVTEKEREHFQDKGSDLARC